MNSSKGIIWSTAVLLVTAIASTAFSHCEIPCGIYGDKMRIDMWEEQIATVEKSMQEIIRLSNADEVNYNQIVRWVINKDKHADDIREIAVQYFLAQRVKFTDNEGREKYLKQLESLHRIVVFAMKAKQTTDLKNVEELRKEVSNFYELYFDEKMKEHLDEHNHE